MPEYEIKLLNSDGELLLQYAANFDDDDKASEAEDDVEDIEFSIMEIRRDGRLVHTLHNSKRSLPIPAKSK